jgi:hypothetical protein
MFWEQKSVRSYERRKELFNFEIDMLIDARGMQVYVDNRLMFGKTGKF